jgi:hypothetical protein
MKKLRSQVERLDGHPAVVIASRKGDHAIVSVCLQKPNTEPPIPAEDLDARAFDTEGKPLVLLERPCPGSLIEVVTMGVTASGRFVFALKPNQRVSHVDVHLGNDQAIFQVRWPEDLHPREPKAG